MFQFPTLTILLPGDIVPVSNRQRWRRSRKIRPERDAEAGSVLRAFAAGTTPEPLANAECRMQNAEWISTLPRVLFVRKLCRARPLQRSQATARFVAVSRVEPWDVLDYLRLTPDTLRGEAFCFAPSSVQSPHHSRPRYVGPPIPLPCTSSPKRTRYAGLRFGLDGEPNLERSQESCPKK